MLGAVPVLSRIYVLQAIRVGGRGALLLEGWGYATASMGEMVSNLVSESERDTLNILSK